MTSPNFLPIVFDSRWIGSNGIGRFAHEISNRINFLHKIDHKINPTSFISPLVIEHWLKSNNSLKFFSPGFIPPLSEKYKFVFTIHDLNHIDLPYNSSHIKKIFYSQVIRPAIHKAQFVFTVSEYSKARIVEWANCDADKIINVGNGVSNSFTTYSEPEKPGFPYIFCCSNRKRHKNEERLIRAYKHSNLFNDIKLVLTGNSSQEIEFLIQSLSLQGSVIFTGEVSEPKLAAWYRGAISTIFPSLYEGFGFPIIESMACGTPIITSKTTSMPEIAGDAALYVDPYNIDEISYAMLRITSDQELRSSLQQNGLIRAKQYTWDSTASIVKEYLSKI